jgi:disulfide bond formation protein DsbB
MTKPAAWRAATLAFLAGLFAILAAWAFQLIGGFLPCDLCLQERVPYYVALPLMAVGLLASKRLPILARLLYVAAAVTFLYGAGLATYHAGAAWNFWLGPNDCGNKPVIVSNAGNLLAAMQATRLVSCEAAALRIFGISFAGWNALSCLFIALMLGRSTVADRSAIL